MVHQTSLPEKTKSRFSNLFSTLQISHLLRQAGISKSFGFSSLAIFQLLFSLVFKGRNWFRLLESDRRQRLPGKDVVYRLLNHLQFAWRKIDLIFVEVLDYNNIKDRGAAFSKKGNSLID